MSIIKGAKRNATAKDLFAVLKDLREVEEILTISKEVGVTCVINNLKLEYDEKNSYLEYYVDFETSKDE